MQPAHREGSWDSPGKKCPMEWRVEQEEGSVGESERKRGVGDEEEQKKPGSKAGTNRKLV